MWRRIHRCYKRKYGMKSALDMSQVGPVKVYPLYSTLPPQQQQKIFEPVCLCCSSRGPCMCSFICNAGAATRGKYRYKG